MAPQNDLTEDARGGVWSTMALLAHPLEINTFDAAKRRRLKHILSRIQPLRKLAGQSCSVFLTLPAAKERRQRTISPTTSLCDAIAPYTVAATASASTGRMLTRFLVRLSHSNFTVPSTIAKSV
jgi:hypothetical protein